MNAINALPSLQFDFQGLAETDFFFFQVFTRLWDLERVNQFSLLSADMC